MEQSGKESRERLRLSPSARVPGAEIAHAYRASTHAEALGSDFYDVFEMGEGRLAVLIGDVSMRGEEGVALAGSLVLTARSAVLRDGHASPSSVMVEVNRRVLQDAPADAFATMVFGTMEQDGLFRYLNAGHTPFLVVSPSRILELSASSTILGLFEDLPAETSEVWLEAQDVLLLMTNGVLDCRGPDGTYGRQRLWECVSSCERVEPGAIVECVLEDVVRYAGGTFADDLALLAVRPLS